VGTAAYSAATPSRSNGVSAKISSPGISSSTPEPTASTTPESSYDGIAGSRSTGQSSSPRVIAAVRTRTSASPGAATGRSISSTTTPEGPPWSRSRTARIAPSLRVPPTSRSPEPRRRADHTQAKRRPTVQRVLVQETPRPSRFRCDGSASSAVVRGRYRPCLGGDRRPVPHRPNLHPDRVPLLPGHLAVQPSRLDGRAMSAVLRGVECRPACEERAFRSRGFVVGSVGLGQMALQGKAGTDQTVSNCYRLQSVPVLCLLTREGTGTGTPGADSHFLRGFLPFRDSLRSGHSD
jgi:hypothetical protein